MTFFKEWQLNFRGKIGRTQKKLSELLHFFRRYQIEIESNFYFNE